MKRIRIVSTPPGFAPEKIRKQWVGLELELASEEEVRAAAEEDGSSMKDVEGYVVRGHIAVEALMSAGKDEAVTFWSFPLPPRYLEFASDCCEEL